MINFILISRFGKTGFSGFLLGTFFLLALPGVMAQPAWEKQCSTHKLNNHSRKLSPDEYKLEKKATEGQRRTEQFNVTGESVIQIPVVVHIIHNDLAIKPVFNRSSNISDLQVFTQIRVLNEDFRRKINTHGYNTHPLGADVGIEFCLASTDPYGMPTQGINRIYSPKESWRLEEEAQLKALSYWPSDKYLNIWVSVLDLELGFGYARYPFGTEFNDLDQFDIGAELDGIVIDHRVFGTTGSATVPYNLGRTTTHEVGHWLGLHHIWGEFFCGDDFVEDTPQDAEANTDFDCLDSSACDGNYRLDMTNNYMDWSPDKCMNLFTLGQKERMLKCLFTSPRRRGLFTSHGCSGAQNDKLYVNAYPNPASDELNIELYWPGHQSADLELYNQQGKLLSSLHIDIQNREIFKLDISSSPTGIYFLKISNGKDKKLQKIFIQ